MVTDPDKVDAVPAAVAYRRARDVMRLSPAAPCGYVAWLTTFLLSYSPECTWHWDDVGSNARYIDQHL
jgi:hypothetical protein